MSTGSGPLLHVRKPMFTGPQRVVKEVFDRAGAALLLILCAVPMIAIAIAIRVTSPGPALFRQKRVGVGGKEFTCFKFRSMYTDAEARRADLAHLNERSDGLLFKLKTDPRVTKFGGLLRRSSLDELPQLLNVLAGSMSLVGPRPPLPSEVAAYDEDVRRRLMVKPGLTGLWQVSGRSNLSWAESVRLDLHYVDNWSPLLDIRILGRTVTAVARGTGAYCRLAKRLLPAHRKDNASRATLGRSAECPLRTGVVGCSGRIGRRPPQNHCNETRIG
jgi:exopolysaccharide biosynthesis polyprenyl glycosylphosphotransferase